MRDQLRLVVCTPREVVLDTGARSLRLPCRSGSLAPRGASTLLPVPSGLIVIDQQGRGLRYLATAGGLLDAGCDHAVLYTPFAVVGEHEERVLEVLRRALEASPLRPPENDTASREDFSGP